MSDDGDSDKLPTFQQEGQTVSDKQYNISRVEGGVGHIGDVYHVSAQVKPTISLETALAQLAKMPVYKVPEPGDLPFNSRMPYGVNPKFTGRGDDFKKLAATMKGAGQAVVVNQAITGLGGVGKTQLAAEFAHRYGRYFLGGVYWLSFADPNAIPAEIAACGRRIDLPGLDAMPLAEQVEKVIGEWEKPMPRLLIFDNCEQEALFEKYRPKSGGARVIMTSRRGRWSPGFGLAALPLGLFSRDESMALLQQFCPPLTGDQAGVIAEALGDLPLALHLAGSYLNFYEGAVKVADFLVELEKEGPFHEALSGEIEGHLPTQHERHVARTFELSYVQLNARDLAYRILLHLAHLAPGEPVPDLLLKATFGLEEDRPSDKEFMKARQRLVKLGLVMVDGERNLRLHRLVGLYVSRVVGQKLLYQTQTAVEKGVNSKANQLIETGYPDHLLPWQIHLRHLTNAAFSRDDEEVAKLANNLGRHLENVADHSFKPKQPGIFTGMHGRA